MVSDLNEVTLAAPRRSLVMGFEVRSSESLTSMRGVYSHITPGMRADVKAGLQELRDGSLKQCARLAPESRVAVLDALLAPQREPAFKICSNSPRDRSQSRARRRARSVVRWVNAGSTPNRANVEWLREGVRQALQSAAENVGGGGQFRDGRVRPLVGLPAFDTGAGGFGGIRGEALAAVLAECDRAAAEHGYDVVIVCWDRADYAALQELRLEGRHELEALRGDLE